jgi:hypothetical protein
MHIADVDKGMLGANGIGTLAVPIGQIAVQNIGDVTVGIGGSAITSPAP